MSRRRCDSTWITHNRKACSESWLVTLMQLTLDLNFDVGGGGESVCVGDARVTSGIPRLLHVDDRQGSVIAHLQHKRQGF